MRNIMFASIALVGLGSLAAPAVAQLNLNIDNREPLTKLDPETWASMEKRFVNAKPIIGKPDVYMINATPDPIVAVNCQSWKLVGTKPYIEDNPSELPPWSVTLVNAKGFDGYCKNGVVAMTASGDSYEGTLNASDHTFSNSTFVTFSPKTKR